MLGPTMRFEVARLASREKCTLQKKPMHLGVLASRALFPSDGVPPNSRVVVMNNQPRSTGMNRQVMSALDVGTVAGKFFARWIAGLAVMARRTKKGRGARSRMMGRAGALRCEDGAWWMSR